MMRLETEFRLRLQLMGLEQAWRYTTPLNFPHADGGDDRCPLPYLMPQRVAEVGMWVKLLQAPGLLSGDEALLLCPLENRQWLAWVPDYGEITLDQDEFYLSWDEL